MSLKNILGITFLDFIVNKKSRKKYKYIPIHDYDYLVLLSKDELIVYVVSLFSKLSLNIEELIKDLEFNKYLKIIMIGNSFLLPFICLLPIKLSICLS